MNANPAKKYSLAEAGVRMRHGELLDGVKGFSRKYIYELMAGGLLHSVRIGSRQYITEQEIRNYESAIATGAIDGWNIRR